MQRRWIPAQGREDKLGAGPDGFRQWAMTQRKTILMNDEIRNCRPGLDPGPSGFLPQMQRRWIPAQGREDKLGAGPGGFRQWAMTQRETILMNDEIRNCRPGLDPGPSGFFAPNAKTLDPGSGPGRQVGGGA